MTITQAWIASLAPDAASLKAGLDLAEAQKWQNLSKHSDGIWGDCQGSAKKPYQVRIGFQDMRIYCTCPSRKSPCKHALGLLTLFEKDAESFHDQSTLPEILLPKIATPKTEKETVKDDTKKAAAQAKRQAEREKKINDGLDALELWINDLARNGLSRLRPNFYQDIAARMVDAQAGGLAHQLRDLASVSLQGNHYEHQLLQKLSQIFLLTQAYRCQEKLSLPLKEEVRRRVGWNVNKSEILEAPGIVDHWRLLGKNYEEQERVISEQLWFIGKHSQKLLLIWNFLAGNTTPSLLQVNQVVDAKVHFYQSPWPLRGIFAEKSEGITYLLLTDTAKNFDINTGYETWQGFLENFSLCLAENPFLDKFPGVIHEVTIQRHEKDDFILVDSIGQALPLQNRSAMIWRFLAVSRGQPVTAFIFFIHGVVSLQTIFFANEAFHPESSPQEF